MMAFARTTALLVITGTAAGALASFEMMLVGDSLNQRIHRYDAETGIYLGSFGQAIYGIQDVVANAATGTCYMLGYGQVGNYIIQSYNFHTGRFLGEVMLPFSGFGKLSLSTNGEFLLGRADAVYRFNTAGVQQGVPLKYSDNNFSYATGGGVQHSGGNYYVFGDGNATWPNDYVMSLNSASTWQGNYQVPLAATAASFVDGVVSGDKFVTLLSYGTGDFAGYILNKNAGNASLNLQLAFGIGADALESTVEFAHTNSLMYLTYGFADAGQAGGYMYRMTPATTSAFSSGQEKLMPQVGRMAGTSMVLAPEPGSMIALGLGAAALLAKRRRK